MPFKERQQIAICAAAAIMIVAFALLRYLPLQKRAKAVTEERTAQMLAIMKASSAGRKLSPLKEELLQLQRSVKNYERLVPSERALGEFLQEIAGLMNEHNLREQLVQPGEEIEAGELNCIPVNMQCKGTLAQLFEFYKSLQKLDRLARIEEVKLINDSNFNGEVSMQTRAVIYYRKNTGQG